VALCERARRRQSGIGRDLEEGQDARSPHCRKSESGGVVDVDRRSERTHLVARVVRVAAAAASRPAAGSRASSSTVALRAVFGPVALCERRPRFSARVRADEKSERRGGRTLVADVALARRSSSARARAARTAAAAAAASCAGIGAVPRPVILCTRARVSSKARAKRKGERRERRRRTCAALEAPSSTAAAAAPARSRTTHPGPGPSPAAAGRLVGPGEEAALRVLADVRALVEAAPLVRPCRLVVRELYFSMCTSRGRGRGAHLLSRR